MNIIMSIIQCYISHYRKGYLHSIMSSSKGMFLCLLKILISIRWANNIKREYIHKRTDKNSYNEKYTKLIWVYFQFQCPSFKVISFFLIYLTTKTFASVKKSIYFKVCIFSMKRFLYLNFLGHLRNRIIMVFTLYWFPT